MMQRVLLTGGSGFLGRHIKAEAENRGHRIFAPRSAEMDLVTGEGIESYMAKVQGEVGKIDVIVHASAYYGGIGINQSEPAEIFYRNGMMALNMFEIARQHGIRKIIPIGSACAYPGHLAGRLDERSFWDGPLHDSVEAYGFSKRMQLVGQRAYYKQHGIEGTHLVLTNMYGPHDVFNEYRGHVVGAMIKKFVDAKLGLTDGVVLWGDGSPVRDFIHVRDATVAIIDAIDLSHNLEPMNIGTGVGTSMRAFAELIAECAGYRGEIVWDTSRPNGTPYKVLSVEKSGAELGFEPKIPLAEGIRETVDWYVANKEEADSRQ